MSCGSWHCIFWWKITDNYEGPGVSRLLWNVIELLPDYTASNLKQANCTDKIQQHFLTHCLMCASALCALVCNDKASWANDYGLLFIDLLVMRIYTLFFLYILLQFLIITEIKLFKIRPTEQEDHSTCPFCWRLKSSEAVQSGKGCFMKMLIF